MHATRHVHAGPAQGGCASGRCFRIPCYVWLLLVVLAIIVYGWVLRRLGAADVLERKVIDDPAVHNFDGWAGTHFLFWAFLGFLYPGHHVQALAASLGWEAVEDRLGRSNLTVGGRRLQLVGDTDAAGAPAAPGAKPAFWYGRYVTDTFFNLAGYILGSAAGARWFPDRPCA